MAARPTDYEVAQSDRRGSVGVSDLPPLREQPRQRVMSVSPTDAERRETVVAENSYDQEVFLTPRVLDQRVFDELAGTLRSLLDEADEKVGRIKERLDQAGRYQAAPGAAAEQLQERLRLGARMMKAFQSQIDRVESLLGDLGRNRDQTTAASEGLQNQMKAIEAKAADAAEQTRSELSQAVEASLEEFSRRVGEHDELIPDFDAIEGKLDSLVQSAVDRFSIGIEAKKRDLAKLDEAQGRIECLVDAAIHRIDAHIRSRQEETIATSNGIEDLRTRAINITTVIDKTEVNLASLAHRVGEALQQMKTKSDDAREIMLQCIEAKGMLGDAIVEGADRIDELSDRCDEVVTTTERRISRCEAAGQRTCRDMKGISEAVEKLESASGMCNELQQLLVRIEPWEDLLIHSPRANDGTPAPVSSMIESLQTGLSKDLAVLSTTMREVAQRVDEIGLPESGAIEEDTAPEIVTTVNGPVSQVEARTQADDHSPVDDK